VVAARKWVEFVRSLKRDATFNVDLAEQSIADDEEDLRLADVKDAGVRRAVARRRLLRRKNALLEARAHRAQVRELLLLDDEDTDGIS
jgi:hypothetical protein